MNFPPKVALSKLVNSLKGVAARRMRQAFPETARHFWRIKRLWSGSYFAGSVGGAPIEVLRRPCASTSNNRSGQFDSGLRPARRFTTGLEAGALRRPLVADRLPSTPSYQT